jgi:DnaJ-class molecular chaperone
MEESFYDILGINEKSTKDEIKKAYRSLSLKYHPDKTQNDSELTKKFQKINEAYETLGNEEKKEEYDLRNSGGIGINNIDDIFNAIFGGGLGGIRLGGMNMGGQRMGNMGQNIHVFSQGGHPIHLNEGFCPGLFTQAFSHPSFIKKPPAINKTIIIDIEQVLTGATIPLEIEKWIIENDNKVFENETLYVTIPKGIDNDEIIILKEKGNCINEDIKGDVKVIIKVNNNSIFKREGLDLILEKTITLKESLCGFSFEIKYINNKIYTINNNSGNIISPEYRKLIPNMGLIRDNNTGNLIIIFHIEFPEKLLKDQIDKLREIFI